MEDQILVQGLRVFAYHGVNPEEKKNGQPFEFDIAAAVDLSLPGQTDRVEDTVSYAQIIKETVRVATAQKDDLLERVAQRIAEALFARFEKIESLRIRVKKPEAPIRADFSYVAVEIVRTREMMSHG